MSQIAPVHIYWRAALRLGHEHMRGGREDSFRCTTEVMYCCRLSTAGEETASVFHHRGEAGVYHDGLHPRNIILTKCIFSWPNQATPWCISPADVFRQEIIILYSETTRQFISLLKWKWVFVIFWTKWCHLVSSWQYSFCGTELISCTISCVTPKVSALTRSLALTPCCVCMYVRRVWVNNLKN